MVSKRIVQFERYLRKKKEFRSMYCICAVALGDNEILNDNERAVDSTEWFIETPFKLLTKEHYNEQR